MNILLIYPKTPVTFWSFKNAIEFIGKRSSEPPLGLLTVASLLPETWRPRLVDTNVSELTDADVKWADLVFLSGMDLHRDSFEEIASRCKRLGATVVGGGPFCTMHHEEIANVDYFVLDEAELTLPLFLSDFEDGQPEGAYRSDTYPDIRTTPSPSWHLLDINAYATMDVQYSRGCPFDCEFCSVTAMFGHKSRCKDTVQFLKEIDSLYELGWRGSVFVVDDNFIGNRAKLKGELLPALQEWSKARNYPFLFNTEVSVNLADDEELMDAMIDAGFRMVFVGIETPDEASLRECGKVQNQGKNLLESVNILQRKGLDVTAGFIVGFDSDREDIFDRQIAFIQRSGIVTAMVGLLTAETGTRLYSRLAGENRILEATTGNNTDGILNFIPRLDKSVLISGYKRVVQTIYSPRAFFHRVTTFLSEYRKPATGPKSRDKWNVIAFLRAIWKIGIIEEGRGYFWKLMFHVLHKYPEAFADAVRMSIYGYHFRKVADRL